MTAPIVFLDTETTGLDPDHHELWEIAIIDPSLPLAFRESVWRPRPGHLETADPNALRLTDYYARTRDQEWSWARRDWVAEAIAPLLAGKHIVAAVPSFDATFLAAFLREHDLREAWHYHLVDVEALAAGKLGIAPPWDSADLARQLGINAEDPRFAKHTALGDARWAKAIYEAALGRVEE